MNTGHFHEYCEVFFYFDRKVCTRLVYVFGFDIGSLRAGCDSLRLVPTAWHSFLTLRRVILSFVVTSDKPEGIVLQVQKATRRSV